MLKHIQLQTRRKDISSVLILPEMPRRAVSNAVLCRTGRNMLDHVVLRYWMSNNTKRRTQIHSLVARDMVPGSCLASGERAAVD